MRESIITEVLVKPKEDDSFQDVAELQLIVDVEEDIVEIVLDGKEIAICSWTHNLKEVFRRALEIWK